MSLPLDAPSETRAHERRFVRVAATLLAGYLLLALAHSGEFWPFSRFPMFSRASKPWLRATLRELSATELAAPLRIVGERDLPGVPFALAALQIDQNDLSEVIKRMGDTLEPEELSLLERYCGRVGERTLVLYAVHGRLRSDRSVRVRYRPLALLSNRGVQAIQAVQEGDGGSR